MSRRIIGILVLLATLSVIGIVITQIYWLDKAFKVQQTQLDLRKQQANAEDKQFNDRVVIALTNVANEILTINNDPAELFQAVKQLSPNYFTVAINDTVHPYLLESLLTSEFEQRNIREDFEYGIYDCFTDSIVYGNFVPMESDSAHAVNTAPKIKWDKDGHYFGVFFPNREMFSFEVPPNKVSTWAFSAIITVIVFIFFAYAIFVILKQKRLSEMKTDFINNMTHELKTPISTISLSSEVLLKPEIIEQPERLHRYADIIYKENQRLKNQVEKVLQLAALDRHKIELKTEALDVHQTIRDTAAAFQVSLDERDGKLNLSLHAENSVINGDHVHVSNMIANLLDNANKYSLSAPEIEIITWNSSGQLAISVKDSGIGIPKNSFNNIFDKFYRVPTGNVHDVKGYGLGLYYVKLMVEAHKGKIMVKSTTKKGSTFTIYLPLFKA